MLGGTSTKYVYLFYSPCKRRLVHAFQIAYVLYDAVHTWTIHAVRSTHSRLKQRLREDAVRASVRRIVRSPFRGVDRRSTSIGRVQLGYVVHVCMYVVPMNACLHVCLCLYVPCLGMFYRGSSLSYHGHKVIVVLITHGLIYMVSPPATMIEGDLKR